MLALDVAVLAAIVAAGKLGANDDTLGVVGIGGASTPTGGFILLALPAISVAILVPSGAALPITLPAESTVVASLAAVAVSLAALIAAADLGAAAANLPT